MAEFKDPKSVRLGLNDFITNVTGKGLAKSNYFSAIIYPPPLMLQANFKSPITTTNFALQCDSASIPGLSLMTNDVAVYGEARQMPTQRLFSEMSLSFYVDLDLTIKKYFDAWMDFIINPNTRTCRYYDDYTTQMEVIVHDKNFNIRYKVKLFECYPKAINNVTLDYNDHNPMKLSVSIQYKYYKIEDIVSDNEKLQEFLKNSLNSDVSSVSSTNTTSTIKNTVYVAPIPVGDVTTVTKIKNANDVIADPIPNVTSNYTYIPYTG